MPNGGIPLHMILKPSLGEGYVFYARGSTLHLISADAWAKHGPEAVPLLSITPDELRVLAAFIQHWSDGTNTGPVYSAPGVNVEFDW
jgi:hypothetical protein